MLGGSSHWPEQEEEEEEDEEESPPTPVLVKDHFDKTKFGQGLDSFEDFLQDVGGNDDDSYINMSPRSRRDFDSSRSSFACDIDDVSFCSSVDSKEKKKSKKKSAPKKTHSGDLESMFLSKFPKDKNARKDSGSVLVPTVNTTMKKEKKKQKNTGEDLDEKEMLTTSNRSRSSIASHLSSTPGSAHNQDESNGIGGSLRQSSMRDTSNRQQNDPLSRSQHRATKNSDSDSRPKRDDLALSCHRGQDRYSKGLNDVDQEDEGTVRAPRRKVRDDMSMSSHGRQRTSRSLVRRSSRDGLAVSEHGLKARDDMSMSAHGGRQRNSRSQVRRAMRDELAVSEHAAMPTRLRRSSSDDSLAANDEDRGVRGPRRKLKGADTSLSESCREKPQDSLSQSQHGRPRVRRNDLYRSRSKSRSGPRSRNNAETNELDGSRSNRPDVRSVKSPSGEPELDKSRSNRSTRSTKSSSGNTELDRSRSNHSGRSRNSLEKDIPSPPPRARRTPPHSYEDRKKLSEAKPGRKHRSRSCAPDHDSTNSIDAETNANADTSKETLSERASRTRPSVMSPRLERYKARRSSIEYNTNDGSVRSPSSSLRRKTSTESPTLSSGSALRKNTSSGNVRSGGGMTSKGSSSGLRRVRSSVDTSGMRSPLSRSFNDKERRAGRRQIAKNVDDILARGNSSFSGGSTGNATWQTTPRTRRPIC